MSSSTAAALAGFRGLELLPVHEHLVGAGHLDLAEDMRVAVDELLDEALRDVVDVPTAVVGGHLRVEHDLEQHVAELVAHRVVVAGVDRLEQLVRLLEQVTRERLMRLLGVPRAPAGAAQPRHHAHEVEQPLALLRARNRALGNVGEQVARARGRLGHGAGVPSSPSLGGAVGGAARRARVGAVHGDHGEGVERRSSRTSGSPRRPASRPDRASTR